MYDRDELGQQHYPPMRDPVVQEHLEALQALYRQARPHVAALAMLFWDRPTPHGYDFEPAELDALIEIDPAQAADDLFDAIRAEARDAAP
jgi:hypothetical protein